MTRYDDLRRMREAKIAKKAKKPVISPAPVITPKPAPVISPKPADCPVCAARRKAQREATARWRKDQKAAAATQPK
jgi:hypothetical protein